MNSLYGLLPVESGAAAWHHCLSFIRRAHVLGAALVQCFYPRDQEKQGCTSIWSASAEAP